MPTMNTGRSSPGPAGLASVCRARSKRFGGEARNEAVVLCGQRRAIEAHRHRLEPVCLFVMPHRLCVIAQIVVGLAQSEVNVDARKSRRG